MSRPGLVLPRAAIYSRARIDSALAVAARAIYLDFSCPLLCPHDPISAINQDLYQHTHILWSETDPESAVRGGLRSR